MKKLILLITVLCGTTFSHNSFAQHENKVKTNSVEQAISADSQSSEKTKLNTLLSELEGTYQFQITKSDYKPVLSIELLENIKNSRTENQDIYLTIDEFTKLFIPSRSSMGLNNFEKLERIIYISKI